LRPDTTLKVDCNISINGGKRVEVKNVSGYAAVEKALLFELARQKQEVMNGNVIEQHTRAFNADTGMTIELRKKETEEDYGYIFDPDLVQVSLTKEYLDEIKLKLPELPEQKARRLMSQFGFSEYDARVLCSDFNLGKLFDDLVVLGADPVVSARLVSREVLSVLNHDALSWKEIVIDSKDLAGLIELIKQEKVSDKNAKLAVINYISGDKMKPVEYLEKNNLLISQSINLEEVVGKVISSNEKAVSDYKAGNTKALNFLAGLVMKETKGTAIPQKIQDLIKSKLG
jgi:aspartyl-tRNA(Asn)/glutamyl-tRNA(Gln) amidotransferase subunit B